MRPSCAPSELSPEQRRHEVAGILASGVLRQEIPAMARRSAQIPNNLSQNPPPDALRLRAKPCSVSQRVNGSETPEKGEPLWH